MVRKLIRGIITVTGAIVGYGVFQLIVYICNLNVYDLEQNLNTAERIFVVVALVFIIGLSEGTFPDYRAIQNGGNELEQEKNNMYVAVTRAKRLCYMSYPARKKMPWGAQKLQQPSRYIQDICVNSS